LGQSSFAPSSLLFYVGFDKKLKTYHIMLCFLMWILSACKDIYDAPQWPKEPLFYANPDKTAAPEGMESGFFLVPLAPGINDSEELREEYFNKIIDRFEHLTQQSVKK
jgi:phytoene desaturase